MALIVALILTDCRPQKPAHNDAENLWCDGETYYFNGKADIVMGSKKAADSLTIVLSKVGFRKSGYKNHPFHELTPDEVDRAHTLLADFIKRGGGDTIYHQPIDEKTGKPIGHRRYTIIKPLPMDDYFKQYIGYTAHGHVMVEINLATHLPTLEEDESAQSHLRNEYLMVRDGGRNFGQAIIDLTEGRVVSFHLNGAA